MKKNYNFHNFQKKRCYALKYAILAHALTREVKKNFKIFEISMVELVYALKDKI
jgi:sulfur transfer complex TusBCD TusB component (DsrH family)